MTVPSEKNPIDRKWMEVVKEAGNFFNTSTWRFKAISCNFNPICNIWINANRPFQVEVNMNTAWPNPPFVGKFDKNRIKNIGHGKISGKNPIPTSLRLPFRWTVIMNTRRFHHPSGVFFEKEWLVAIVSKKAIKISCLFPILPRIWSAIVSCSLSEKNEEFGKTHSFLLLDLTSHGSVD